MRACRRLIGPMLLCWAGWAAAGGGAAQPAGSGEEAGAGREARLIHLVRQDCGSCHGLRLSGGLGPPLTPRALSGKSGAYLEHVILHGIPGTAMPGWQGIVAPAEAAWIAGRLLDGFPQE
ncbi:c-type cytochrome [Achromobacter denitrificans]|uniref:c-type cytochrome n=1 Tax=Achromobacter denitrificans TaxID=32002 RepID=UPI0020CFAF1B|nr:cytochrome c [Achromobacter denitrificans]